MKTALAKKASAGVVVHHQQSDNGVFAGAILFRRHPDRSRDDENDDRGLKKRKPL